MDEKQKFDVTHALVLLVREIISQIDEVWSLKKQGHNAKLSRYLLSEMAKVVQDLDEELQEKYFSVLITLFCALDKPARHSVGEDHAQYSQKIKKRFLTDIRESLKAS